MALQTPKLPPVDLTPNPNDSGSPHCPPLGCLSRGGVGVGGLQGGGVSQSVLHLLGGFAVQLPVGVLEDVVAPHVHGHVLLPQSFIQPLQLLAEIPTTRWIRGGGGGEEKKAKKIK